MFAGRFSVQCIWWCIVMA